MADDKKVVSVLIKVDNEMLKFDVNELISVEEFKQEIAPKLNTSMDQLCMIFAGKILDNSPSLSSYGIKDESIVHVVRKSADRSQEQIEQACALTSNISIAPFGIADLTGLEKLGMGSANFMDLQQKMQSQLLNNPDLLQQVVENPFVQSLMSNPEYMKQLLSSNSQMQELMVRNPEIRQSLNNPELLQETLEIVKNPGMLKVLMKSQDKVLNNVENSPGTATSDDTQDEQSKADTSLNSDGTPDSKMNLKEGSVINNPAMQSLMQQLIVNPQLMQNMFNAPYVQAMLQFLTTNPQMSEQFISTHPIFADDPKLQEKMRIAMPNCLRQLQNPEVHNLISNPEAMQAVLQIQQGMDQLHHLAPTVFNRFPGQPANSTVASSTSQGSSTNTFQDSFKQFMASMVTSMAQNENNSEVPEERFCGELEQLSAMGFPNKADNISALVATSGDVNAAIEQLLQAQQ